MPDKPRRTRPSPKSDPEEQGSAGKQLQTPNPPSVDPAEEGSAARQQR